MKTIKTLDMKDAKEVLAAIEKIAEKMSLKLSICIVDSAANIIIHERMDDAAIFTFDLSRSKASTAISMRNTSGTIHSIIKEHKAEMTYFNGSVKSAWKGGVPAFSPDDMKTPVGAIGVSGGTQDEDEEIAIAGLKAIGLGKEFDVKNK